MPRKATDNPEARNAAAEMIAHSEAAHVDRSEAGGIIQAFPVAEFETATSRVSGEQITLRRVVLTGHWEVVSTT